jgi:hypothetical protein
MQSWPTKDPDEILDYQFNWADRLEEGETIFTSTFIVGEGDVEISDPEVNGALTKVWVSGGTAGSRNVVTNRITTSAGRVYDYSAALRIRSH